MIHLVLEVDGFLGLLVSNLSAFEWVARLSASTRQSSIYGGTNKPLKALEVEVCKPIGCLQFNSLNALIIGSLPPVGTLPD